MHTGFVLLPDGRYQVTKDPDDSLLYGRDISARFPGRTISTVVVPSGGSSGVTAGTPTASGSVASVRVSAGPAAGSTGSVTLRCTLDNGEVTDLTLHFLGVDR